MLDKVTKCVKSALLLLTSGVAATRFSKGKCSLGTPTVNLEYGIPFGVSSSLVAAEKYLCKPAEDDESLCRQRSPSDRTLPGLMEVRRIMIYECLISLNRSTLLVLSLPPGELSVTV